MAGVNNRVKVTNDIELKDRLVAINREIGRAHV